jgi:alanine racemase
VAAALRPEAARIDLDRLEANYRAVLAFAGRPLMPVVKADAYGHGAPQVALAFEALGVPLLAVAFTEEGAALRRAGVRVPILVMAGVAPEDAELAAASALTPVVASERSLAGAARMARGGAGERLAVHLKLDTGMSRLGFRPEAAVESARRAVEAGLIVDGLMTHLAEPDEDAAATAAQLDRFDDALADLVRHGFAPRWVHAANSAGLAQIRPSHTLARPGILLYGLRPRPLSPPIEVRPVMALVGRVEAVKQIAPGTAVSYGGRWVAARVSRIATVSIGYADGVPRTQAMSQSGQFTIRGRRVPVVGTVCMDFTMLDVTDAPEIGEADEAILFGDDPTAWQIADWAGTNAWEVLTSVGLRVPRVYVRDGRELAVLSRY